MTRTAMKFNFNKAFVLVGLGLMIYFILYEIDYGYILSDLSIIINLLISFLA